MSEDILNKEGLKQIKEALEELEEDLSLHPDNTQLQKLKSMLLKREKNVKNYYVPYLDLIRSPLIEKIPIEEEILYCSNAYIHWNVKPDISQDWDRIRGPPSSKRLLRESMVGKFVPSTQKMKLKGDYFSYVFIFHRGIFLKFPYFLALKTPLKSVGIYKTFPGLVPWSRVTILDNGNMIIDGYIKCDMERIPDFESESNFEFRKRIFKREILRIRHSYTLNCLEKARFYDEQNDYELALNWVKNGLYSNVFPGEFDLIDDLMEVKASILNKQSNLKMKKKEERDNQIINFFKSNPGRAYTLDSIMKRLESIVKNPEELDYFDENLEGILNKLLFNHNIQSNKQKDKIFYFLNQES